MPLAQQIGRDLLNVPMGDMIRQMAFAIADAQLQLDESGIRQAELMSGNIAQRDENGELIKDENGDVEFLPSTVSFGYRKEDDKYVTDEVSMMELGFSPTFYQFIDTLIEVKIDIKMTEDINVDIRKKSYRRQYSFNRDKGGFRYQATVTPVDAKFSQKYSYSAEGSSVLRTKLVPVPPPSVLEERARAMLEESLRDRQQNVNNAGGSAEVG